MDKVVYSLFTLVFSISSLQAYADQFVCAFQCYGTNEICQSTYSRTDEGFKDDYHSFFVNENESYISLSSPYVGQDGAAVWSVIINKKTLEFTKSTTSLTDTGYRLGRCVKTR